MHITDVTTKAGAHRRRRRVGRGESSGMGKTCGRGHKGCGSRSGWKQRMLTEGGQMPLFRQIPKRGFSNAKFSRRFAVVNLAEIDAKFPADAHVTPEALREAGLIRSTKVPVKILGGGGLTKKIKIDAACFSASAVEKVKAAGGETKVIPSA